FIQVDGGINSQTALKAVEAGADVLVAGTAVFGNKDYEQAIKEIRQSRELFCCLLMVSRLMVKGYSVDS
ncbi:MAG: hypothetical protein ABH869_07370, partial [Candidatus Omnitrophota bacterium]